MGLTDEQWEVLAPLIEACRPAAGSAPAPATDDQRDHLAPR